MADANQLGCAVNDQGEDLELSKAVSSMGTVNSLTQDFTCSDDSYNKVVMDRKDKFCKE